MRKLTSLFAGLLFGGGLIVSDMINPERVRSFLDLFGDWDPTLAFVMGGAMSVSSLAWWVARRRNVAFNGGALPGAPSKNVDGKLVGGSALFGIGWGIAGMCPGAALAAMNFGSWQIAVFLVAMLGGMAIYNLALSGKPIFAGKTSKA